MRKRHAYLLTAVGLCAAFTGMSAHYGYSLPDNDIDAAIVAFLFGLMTAGGTLALHGSVDAWAYNRVVSAGAFTVATIALMVSLSISVGSWASRNDDIAAQRNGVAQDVGSLSRDLATKQTELEKSATPLWRKRELEEAIKGIRAQIKGNGPVREANAQGAAYARLFGVPENKVAQEAKKLVTWQNMAMGATGELMVFVFVLLYGVQLHADRAELAGACHYCQ